MERLFISQKSDGNTLMSIDILEKTLSAYFPQKQILEIADLVNCAQSIAGAGKDIDMPRLFNETKGADSPFCQLLWRQALNERKLLSRLLQASIHQLV